MDWWKMFGSTFILIFLAELGDKTQLAAMARAAEGPTGYTARWVVFLAASSALVLSTLIAVFFGGVLKSLVSDDRYIKIASGLLFIIVGVWILVGVAQSYSSEAKAAETPAAHEIAALKREPGYIGGLALKAALDFETAVGKKYRDLSRLADPELATLLNDLASEEESHRNRLAGLSQDRLSQAFRPQQIFDTAAVANSPAQTCGDDVSCATLRNLADHEKITADFYQSLADQTIIPSLKPLFAGLAQEERNHAARLEALAQKRA